MAQSTRWFILSACCGVLLAGPAWAVEVEDKGGTKAEEKADRGVSEKGKPPAKEKAVAPKEKPAAREKAEKSDKATQDKGSKAGQEKAAREADRESDRVRAPAEQPAPPQQQQQRPPQQQQRAQATRRAALNDRDYSRLRMGPNGPLPADRTRSTEAKAALEAARAELSRALANTGGNTAVQTENELWRDENYRNAVYEQRRAHAEYDNVRRPIFEMLREDAYYRELERKQQESQKVIQSLVLTGRGSFDYLFPHAMAALEMRKRMTREEIIALAQTPEVEEARQRMLMAAAKVRQIRAEYLAQFNNPQSAAKAREELQAARENVKEAQAAYNAALLEEAEYERIRANYMEEWRRTGVQPTVRGTN